jgi:hypothetical protein
MSFKSLARMSTLAVAALVSGALLMAARGGNPVEEREGERTRAHEIVGTWRVQVTLLDCETRHQVAPPFAAFLTFGRDGTLTETTSASFFPAVRSPGHGAWTAEAGRSFAASSSAFITRDGVLVRTQTITQRIEVDGDSLSSSAAVSFVDPLGTVVARACAWATGERYR